MNNHDPLVSVIVPTFNRARLIGRTITSILEQSYRHWELIVVNDGGTDETAVAISRYHDPRIIYLEKTNGGLSSARNCGVRRATGKYVAFCDDDDTWKPNKLAVQIHFLRQHPMTAVCYTGSTIYEDGKTVAYYFLQMHGDPLHTLLFVNPATVSTFLVQKTCFDKAGLFDESYRILEDHLMWLRMAKYFSFAGIDQPLVEIHRLPGRLGGNYAQNIFDSNRALLRELQQFRQKMPNRIPRRLERNVIAYAEFKAAKAYLYQNQKRLAVRKCIRSIRLNPKNYEAWLLSVAWLLPSKTFTRLITPLQGRGGGRLPNLPKGIGREW